MSASGFFADSTKRARDLCANQVIGAAIRARITNGQKPPAPALIGRNSTPAPTAVPNSDKHQVKSL